MFTSQGNSNLYCLLLRETPIYTVYFSGKLQSILFTSQGNSNLCCLPLRETPIYTVYFSGKLQSILFTSQGNPKLYCLFLRETPIDTVYFSGKLQSILFKFCATLNKFTLSLLIILVNNKLVCHIIYKCLPFSGKFQFILVTPVLF